MAVVEAPERTEPWVALRLVLAVLYVLVLCAAVAGHRSDASLQDLYDDVSSGAVDRVELTGGLPEGSTGYAAQTARWSVGLRHWTAELVVRRPPGTDTQGAVDGERTSDDVAAEVVRRDQDVQVVARDHVSGFGGELYGTRLPALLSVPMGIGLLAGLVLLVSGPSPWRATRWGWFWLSWLPGGALAFLLLSGPVPRLPAPREPHRRIHGLGGLVILVVAGAWLGVLGGELVRVVLPPHR